MNRIKKIFIASFLLLGLTSCYKDVSTSYDEMDVTLTLFDKEFSERTDTNFQTYKTFIIRDSVGLISDYIDEGSSTWTSFYKNGGTSDVIRQAFRQKFIEKGYRQVTDLDSADIAVNLVATLVQNTSYVGYPGYWYGWGGYYPGWGYYYKSTSFSNKPLIAADNTKSANYWYGGGYWGGYYPWYGGGYSYTYETTSIMTEMIDARSLIKYYKFIDGKTDDELQDIPKEDFPMIYYRWQSFIHGVLSDQGSYDSDRFDRGVEEAFTQSPYIYSSNN